MQNIKSSRSNLWLDFKTKLRTVDPKDTAVVEKSSSISDSISSCEKTTKPAEAMDSHSATYHGALVPHQDVVAAGDVCDVCESKQI